MLRWRIEQNKCSCLFLRPETLKYPFALIHQLTNPSIECRIWDRTLFVMKYKHADHLLSWKPSNFCTYTPYTFSACQYYKTKIRVNFQCNRYGTTTTKNNNPILTEEHEPEENKLRFIMRKIKQHHMVSLRIFQIDLFRWTLFLSNKVFGFCFFFLYSTLTMEHSKN